MRRKNYLKYKKLEKENKLNIHIIRKEAFAFKRKYFINDKMFDPLKTNVKRRIIVYKLKSEKKPVPQPNKQINPWLLNPLYITIIEERREKRGKLRTDPGIVITRPYIGENGLKIKLEKRLNCKQQRNMNKYGYSSYIKYRESLK